MADKNLRLLLPTGQATMPDDNEDLHSNHDEPVIRPLKPSARNFNHMGGTNKHSVDLLRETTLGRRLFQASEDQDEGGDVEGEHDAPT